MLDLGNIVAHKLIDGVQLDCVYPYSTTIHRIVLTNEQLEKLNNFIKEEENENHLRKFSITT